MTKIIVTLGPATSTEDDLRKIKDKGVDFVRINMSHSSIDDLKRYIAMAKKVGIPFIIDTEGSQVRTGELETPTIDLEEGDEVKIFASAIVGTKTQFNLKPVHVVPQLEIGDLIHVDFDSVTLRVTDISTLSQGYICTKAITGGTLGKNKATNVDRISTRPITLPPLSEKDMQSIKVGLDEGIGMIAASFMRSGKSVDFVRSATQNTMQVISKVECVEALENLNDILAKSDYVLIDRGDLSREIPLEKIPFTQKIILHRARKYSTPVFVATNLLETMITNKKPTRAEIHDVLNTIVDGAHGLTLAAETAIGKHPMECINMLNNLIDHARLAVDVEEFSDKEDKFVQTLEDKNYLFDFEVSSALIAPHGGKLVNRMAKEVPTPEYLEHLPKVQLDENRQRDVEQIAIGTYSPLEGFMGSTDFHSSLDRMRLANGLPWTLPIWLDVAEEVAHSLPVGSDVGLTNDENEVVAILHLEEKYTFEKEDMAQKMYATLDMEHPGVRMVMNLHPIMLGGKITLLKRRPAEFKEYELTPRQSRKLFDGKGWAKVVAFHTRNVPHRGHEFLQLDAMRRANCDGLFVHPVVGKKKPGD
ncbi:sulfate adenylyltransferase, partial [archaeon]|nr:sulfate adenylyltransferase [archaeon]